MSMVCVLNLIRFSNSRTRLLCITNLLYDVNVILFTSHSVTIHERVNIYLVNGYKINYYYCEFITGSFSKFIPL